VGLANRRRGSNLAFERLVVKFLACGWVLSLAGYGLCIMPDRVLGLAVLLTERMRATGGRS
jgi:hypothetical protein